MQAHVLYKLLSSLELVSIGPHAYCIQGGYVARLCASALMIVFHKPVSSIFFFLLPWFHLLTKRPKLFLAKPTKTKIFLLMSRNMFSQSKLSLLKPK